MSAIDVQDRPTAVEPTETATRKERSDKGKPRPRLSAEGRAAQLRAKADTVEADAAALVKEKARKRAAKHCERAYSALIQARDEMATVDSGKAGLVADLAEMVDGVELGDAE